MKNQCKVLMQLLMLCFCILPGISVKAATIYDSPYVTFSPDGEAWTVAEELPYTGNIFDYHYPDNIPEYWYRKGAVIDTGIESSLRALKTGEHYYKEKRTGEIPVGYWNVEKVTGSCIHDDGTTNFHGISSSMNKCLNAYYSGWRAYCADCNGLIHYGFMYMSKDAVRSITSIDVDKGYYYLCPTCGDLEQGFSGDKAHECKQISWNQYMVQYDDNRGSVSYPVKGYMSKSYHMYNNATEYEGEPVTPTTHLIRNAYYCNGYEFVGWNTNPDGSGTFYADEAEIYNLTDKDWHPDKNADGEAGIITLYAQWKKSASTLRIDPNGGSYVGNTGITSVTQDYMTQYVVDNNKLTAPEGCTVSFEENGGSRVEDITGTQHFTQWSKVNPFLSFFVNDIYTFLAPDGNVDTIRANYEADSITLPETTKPNASFGGWYYDAAFTKPAGGVGDRIIPTKDMTLYAQWVELRLYAKNDYLANSRKGAVDLNWTQSDGKNKAYKLYQSMDAKTWTQINSAWDIGTSLNVTESFSYTGSEQTYMVPYSGLYTLTASGAQGGNYGSFTGGLAGQVNGTFYLKAGDIIKYQVGGQGDTATGGGMGTAGGSGGGYTKVSRLSNGVETLLLMAGGGSGATALENGKPGGSEDMLRTDGISCGENGASGGGGGYVGGASVSGTTTLTAVENSVTFHYTGAPTAYAVPKSGYYKLEVWGAEGAIDSSVSPGYPYAYGGKGGYASGVVYLEAGKTVYVVVGGNGNNANGYNGGGNSHRDSGSGTSNIAYGGGATHIGTFHSTLAAHGNTSGLYIVAGGGGASGDYRKAPGGDGGGLCGVGSGGKAGSGGTQSAGGVGGQCDGDGLPGSFGQGGDGAVNEAGGGGGGGLYGGGGGSYEEDYDDGNGWNYAGGGGSSYVGGVEQGYTITGIQKGNGKAVVTFLSETSSVVEDVTEETPTKYEWICPQTAYYELEVWGAEGGDADFDCGDNIAYGGKGGYAYGELYITKGTVLTIQVGEAGNDGSVDKVEDEEEWGSCNGVGDGGATTITANGVLYLRGDGGEGGSGRCFHHGDEVDDGQPGGYYVNGVLTNTTVKRGVKEGNGKFSIKPKAKPSGGGSNYINTALCVNSENTAGVRQGNGSFSIQSKSIGFIDNLYLNDVAAFDLAAPEAIPECDITIEPIQNSNGAMVKVLWTATEDKGTAYYHKAESHLALTGTKLCTSNITKNTLTTGVSGYYYQLNTSAQTTVTAANGHFAGRATPWVQVTLTDVIQYLHIAPVDVAGNVGATTHVMISPKISIAWALHTNQLFLDGEDNVHPAEAENTWYVRCDDATPFTLQFSAYMEGNATSEYQINQMIFESRMEGSEEAQNVVGIPMYDIGDNSIETLAAELSFSNEGVPVLHNYTYIKTIHSNANRNVSIENQFLTDAEIHGKKVRITPRAGVVTDKYKVYSNEEEDRQNSIYIIGDLEAPEIHGMGVLDGVEVIDRTQGSFVLNLEAEDELSGVREFYVEIHNMDNEIRKTYKADENGSLQIDLTAQDPVFSGDFSIMAVAVDNVGNVSRKEHLLTEFALTVELKRILAPHEPVFQRGESGLLTITTWGYMERVEVEFPNALTELDAELNQTYTYEIPLYEKAEQLQFMVPLYVPEDGEYTIKVTAYKEDRELEVDPELTVFKVEGTVLDDFRTRLR